MVKDNPGRCARSRRRSPGHSHAVVTATVTSSTGQKLRRSARERQEWKVEATATISTLGHATPRDPGFVRAVERQALRRHPQKYCPATKEGLDAAKLKARGKADTTEEIDQVVAGVKQALPSATIGETGDRATMAYSQGHDAARSRGEVSGKIEDFDLIPGHNLTCH